MKHDLKSSKNWAARFTTHTRDEALRVADFVARAIEPRFFHDPEKIPVVVVTGGFNNGKSMMCEAMSRSLLDEESLEDMIGEGQRFHHYLESAPSSAMSEYCYQAGHIGGKPAAVSFDRLATLRFRKPGKAPEDAPSLDNDFQTNFKRFAFPRRFKEGFKFARGRRLAQNPEGQLVSLFEASTKPARTGGIIFSSGREEMLSDANPWLRFHIVQPFYEDTPRARLFWDKDDPGHPQWEKHFTVKALAPELCQSPRFQNFWRGLQAYTQSGYLPDPDTLSAAKPKALKLK